MLEARQIPEAVRHPRRRVQRRRRIPRGHPEIVLLRRQTYLLPRLEATETVVAPRTRDLTRDPRMRRLPDHDQPFRISAVQHQR